jgi:hypothetical protein
MEKQICIRCGEESDSKLPLCTGCRRDLVDFSALVEYLNSFTGSKEDLLWIIGSEISNRESYVINDCNVEVDYINSVINLVPVVPSSSTIKVKPWLKQKYNHIVQNINEISKLRRAYGIAKQYYGVA